MSTTANTASVSRRFNLVPKRTINAHGRYETTMVRADSTQVEAESARRAPLEEPRPVVSQRDMSVSEFISGVEKSNWAYSLIMRDGTEAVLVYDAILSSHSPNPVFHIDHVDLDAGHIYNPVTVALPSGSTGAEIDALIITTVSQAITDRAMELSDRLWRIVETTPTIRETLVINGMSNIEINGIRYDASRARDARLILQANSDVMNQKDRHQLIVAGIID